MACRCAVVLEINQRILWSPAACGLTRCNAIGPSSGDSGYSFLLPVVRFSQPFFRSGLRGLKENADVLGRACSARPIQYRSSPVKGSSHLGSAARPTAGLPAAEVLHVAGELTMQMRRLTRPLSVSTRPPKLIAILSFVLPARGPPSASGVWAAGFGPPSDASAQYRHVKNCQIP